MRPARISVCVAIAAGLAACATVRVVHEHRDASNASTSPAAETVLVQSGDTLYSIASRHGLKVGDLAGWNRLSSPYTIHPGQRLQMAPVAAPATASTMPISAESAVASSPLTEAVTSAVSTVASSAGKRNEVTPAAETSGGGASKWQWPADGTLVARTSITTPGIDIAGHAGAPVRAIADGVVLYSGAGSPGYEELIVIRHDNDWLSSYAHNRKRLVGEGQRVRAGTQIAEMGRIGAAREQLTFEMRHHGELVDPLKVLPQR